MERGLMELLFYHRYVVNQLLATSLSRTPMPPPISKTAEWADAVASKSSNKTNKNDCLDCNGNGHILHPSLKSFCLTWAEDIANNHGPLDIQYLFQRISIFLQRENKIAFLNAFNFHQFFYAACHYKHNKLKLI